MSEPTALIVDDEADIRELLEITLGRMGLATEAVPDLAGARAILDGQARNQRHFNLCLTDMRLPDGDGIELVRLLGEQHPDTPVAVITAHGNMDIAIAALKAGAFDFVSKPVNLEDLRNLVNQALRLPPARTTDSDDRQADRQTGHSTDHLPNGPADETGAGPEAGQLTGRSAAIETVRTRIARVARSQAPVVISGDSGVGKELVARLIHRQGPRADRPFVPVNCGAIPRELMESEFFGHLRGSFTGATADKHGLFATAEGGTLFLDEIAELPLDMQVKLLRAIQEKHIRPVGGTREHPVDVRIVSATHADLAGAVADRRFREDLYYRINVIALHVPPLRERREDIGPLTDAILARIAAGHGAPPTLTAEARAALRGYAFPGNVRELENILERGLAMAEGDEITAEDLQLKPADRVTTTGRSSDAADAETPAEPDDRSAASQPDSLDARLEAQQRELLIDALEAHRWNRTAVARQLGLTYRQLRYRLKKLGID